MREKGEQVKSEFEMHVFANSPKLYYEMFEKDRQMMEATEIEWVRPSSAEDIADIMDTLKNIP